MRVDRVVVGRVIIDLPWPPSVNHYWGMTRSGKTYLTKRAKSYRTESYWLARQAMNGAPMLHGPVQIQIEAYPPDARKRDLDNLHKAPLDALAYANVYEDDYQIWFLQVTRKERRPQGLLRVTIERYTGDK